ncbi:MAG: zinc ribbon domain-containing protein [Bradymonadia bacterium]
MREILSMLVDLQAIDDSMRELRAAEARLTKVQADNAKGLEVFAVMLQKSEAQIEETRAFHGEREKNLQETESNLARSKSRITSVTNQRELNALTKELDNLRRANTQRQEELKQLNEQVAEAQAEHDRRVAERDALKTKMDEAVAKLEAELTERKGQAAEHNTRREEIRAKLPKPEMARYDRIARGRNGLALVAVTEEGTCTACNMAVPPQQFIRLNKLETMESCSNCKRLLYYPAALNGVVEIDPEVGLSN